MDAREPTFRSYLDKTPGRKNPGSPPGKRTVTIVFLVHNRRAELQISLRQMLGDDAYDSDRLDVIVVDNASTDGSADMVGDKFPGVRLIRRSINSGVSAWNDGFAAARGDYVLALDDDCYLPSGSLGQAVAAAEEHRADLVSFAVGSSDGSDYRFTDAYRTGLLSFWGCAVLIRRGVLERLHGYDPEIFVFANELEFTLRFFDAGFRHLHLPEVVAVHMKDTSEPWTDSLASRAYRLNARHIAYIAAKLLRPREAAETLVARLVVQLRDAARVDRAALNAVPHCLAGFATGLRRRRPVRNPAISRVYRHNFESFASPWWLSTPVREITLSAAKRVVRRSPDGSPRPGRRDEYFSERGRYYPSSAATLEF